MKQPHRRTLAVANVCATFALLSACSTPQAPVNTEELPLFAGRLSPGLRLSVADFDRELVLSGDSVVMPKPADARMAASQESTSSWRSATPSAQPTRPCRCLSRRLCD